MRTTIRLNDAILNQAKREAARRGETLTSLIERGVRLALARHPAARRRPKAVLPECHAGGGVLPGLDLNDSAALLDLMEGRR